MRLFFVQRRRWRWLPFWQTMVKTKNAHDADACFRHWLAHSAHTRDWRIVVIPNYQ